MYVCFSYIFFGAIPSLDGGGCVQISVKEGQAVVMPAGFIHMVTTDADSIVIGANFLSMGQLPVIMDTISQEIQDKIPEGERFRRMDVLAMAAVSAAMAGDTSIPIEDLHRLYTDFTRRGSRDTLFSSLAPHFPQFPTSVTAMNEFVDGLLVIREY